MNIQESQLRPIRFTCPECGQAIKVSALAAGKRGKCCGCSKIIAIPRQGIADTAPAPITTTKSLAHPKVQGDIVRKPVVDSTREIPPARNIGQIVENIELIPVDLPAQQQTANISSPANSQASVASHNKLIIGGIVGVMVLLGGFTVVWLGIQHKWLKTPSWLKQTDKTSTNSTLPSARAKPKAGIDFSKFEGDWIVVSSKSDYDLDETTKKKFYGQRFRIKRENDKFFFQSFTGPQNAVHDNIPLKPEGDKLLTDDMGGMRFEYEMIKSQLVWKSRFTITGGLLREICLAPEGSQK